MTLTEFSDIARLMHIKKLYIPSLYEHYLNEHKGGMVPREFLTQELKKKPYLEFKENYNIKILNKSCYSSKETHAC